MTVARSESARTYWPELLAYYAMSSVLPAGLAFALTRSKTSSTRVFSVAGGVVLVVFVSGGLAMTSLLLTSYMLDTHCY